MPAITFRRCSAPQGIGRALRLSKVRRNSQRQFVGGKRFRPVTGGSERTSESQITLKVGLQF